MSVKIEHSTDAKSQFENIGIDAPDGVSIVPVGRETVDSESVIVLPDDSDTVRKLIEQTGVEFVDYTKSEDSSTLVLHSEELILPAIIFTYTTVRDNWDQIKYVLEKISSHYSTQYESEVEFTVEQERADGTTTRLTYQGPADALDEELSDEIEKIIEEDSDDE
ncbi:MULTISPECIES: hypothetical protein [unclassified Halorubrum]|uniref:hypothetical protein n=1 Tax=unclassified Halorubrum TaxID=2642239 RepID=UPI0011C49629|nr:MULTISPECIES: hypothetical protein [unclassified Halorubrum]